MNFLDRLSTAQITAPGGSVHTFAYTELSRSVSHRIGAFEFAGINGTVHQDKGVSGELYPLKAIFYGTDYDRAADAFFIAMKEVGNCELQHPRWGNRRVQVLSISQAEPFVAGIGQAVFDIELQESLQREFPDVNESAAGFLLNVPSNSEIMITLLGTTFIGAAALNTANKALALKQQAMNVIGPIKNTIGKAVTAASGMYNTYTSLVGALQSQINSYTSAPQNFANNVLGVVRLPAISPGKLDFKLRAYDSLLGFFKQDRKPARNPAGKIKLKVRELITSGIAIGVSESISGALTNTQASPGRGMDTQNSSFEGLKTRAEVLAAAVFLRNVVSDVVALADEGQGLFSGDTIAESYVYPIETLNPILHITSGVIGAALNIAFTLPSERVRVLPAESTLINECYALYGNIDDETLDYFILTNGLTGDELLQLPRGKRVKYYV